MENKDLYLNELKTKSYLTDEEFEKYKDVLREEAKDIHKRWKPFTKIGFYYYFGNPQKLEKTKLVCTTKAKELIGEEWLSNPKYGVDVSNYGRIRYEGNVLTQFEKGEGDGYLQVKIPGVGTKLVYQLVIETYKSVDELSKNNYTGYQVHHINENGHENTPENLIWLTKEQHNAVHHYKS